MDVDNDMTYTPLHRDKTEERKNNDYLHKFRHKLDQIRNLSYDLDATMIQTLRDNGSGQEMLDKLDAMQRDIHAMFPEVSGLRRVLKPSVANHMAVDEHILRVNSSNKIKPRKNKTFVKRRLVSNIAMNKKKIDQTRPRLNIVAEQTQREILTQKVEDMEHTSREQADDPDYVPSNSNSNRNQPLRRSKTTLGDAGLDSNSNNKKPRYL
eukprot:597720_1